MDRNTFSASIVPNSVMEIFNANRDYCLKVALAGEAICVMMAATLSGAVCGAMRLMSGLDVLPAETFVVAFAFFWLLARVILSMLYCKIFLLLRKRQKLSADELMGLNCRRFLADGKNPVDQPRQ